MAQPLDRRRPQIREPGTAEGWRWNSRGVLLIAMTLLPSVGVLLYVGPAWANVLWRLISDGGLTLLWLAGVAGLGLFILRAAKLWNPQTPGALRWATAAGLGLGIMSLATLGLGLVGALNSVTAWAMLAVGWLLGGISLRQTHREQGLAVRAWLMTPAGWAWLWLLATPFMVLSLAAAMTPPGMLWTPEEPHGYDVVEYHLQVPREWFEAHRIVPLHHNVFSFFPFNVEMHFLLAMHLHGGPWAGMYLAQLMHLTFMALMVVAVYGLARRFASPASATIAALALLTVPWLTQLAGIAYDEGGFLLFGILAIGWAMIAMFETNDRIKPFMLAGAFAGFAAGSKLTAVPEILVAVPVVAAMVRLWMLFSQRGKEVGSTLWGGILVFGLIGLLTFSPWLIRNIVWAHNPVFPEMMPVLGKGDFDSLQVERFEKAHKAPPAQHSLGARLTTLNREVLGWRMDDATKPDEPTAAWQFGYLILPLGLIAFALSIRRPESWFLLGLLLILTVFWLSMTHLQSRFFILAAPISALLIARINWRRGAIAGAALVAIFAAIGWMRIKDKLTAKLYGSAANNNVGVVSVLATDGAWLYGQMMPTELPKSGTILLIGDARAFLYPIPMSRLRYRTVFDVKDNESDILKAWAGDEPKATDDWLLIDPAELWRFHQTYFGLPPLPADVERAGGNYVVKR